MYVYICIIMYHERTWRNVEKMLKQSWAVKSFIFYVACYVSPFAGGIFRPWLAQCRWEKLRSAVVNHLQLHTVAVTTVVMERWWPTLVHVLPPAFYDHGRHCTCVKIGMVYHCWSRFLPSALRQLGHRWYFTLLWIYFRKTLLVLSWPEDAICERWNVASNIENKGCNRSRLFWYVPRVL